MRESEVDCVCISLPNQISICVDLQTVNRFCVFCVRKFIANTTAELSASSTVFEGYLWKLKTNTSCGVHVRTDYGE